MKAALLTLIALSVALPCALAADRPPVTKFTRADPALTLVERSDSYEKGSFAKWAGKTTLTGKLVVEFDRGPPEEAEPDTAGVAVFEPDAKSRSKLPAALNYHATPVTTIWLEKSPIEVLPTLVGMERALEIVRSKSPRYELPVSIDLSWFSTSVECDHRSYSIGYTAMRLTQPKVVAGLVAKHLGC